MNRVLILALVVVMACSPPEKKYTHDIGYINPEPALGDKNFKVCYDRIFQYYNSNPNANYKYGKKELRKKLLTNFPKGKYTDTGYLTYRFVINCQGEAGRFEINETDLHYVPIEFDEELKEFLLQQIIGLKEWTPLQFEGKPYDSYRYLTFKMINGEIAELLP
jgi:hypothetical protein